MSVSDLPAGTSRVQRVRHETRRRPVEVVAIDRVGDSFRSITFGGESLVDFVSASFDDHVKFILEASDGGDPPTMRDYTPRRHDPVARTLTIEFALHGDGPVAEWAARAKVGDAVVIAGPRGSLIIPVDYAWHLFVADETGLPAIARRLEELPAGAQAVVVGLVHRAGDRRQFASEERVDARWVDTPEAMIEAVRVLPLPPGEGYAWCAGEAATMAALRRVLVDEKGHDRHAIRAAAYWKRGATAHHENLEG